MKVLNIIPDTVVDGPGLRTSVYLAGCKHRCSGCHNPESWSFQAGTEMTVQEIVNQVQDYGHKRITISGGDPFYQPQNLLDLVKALKEAIPGVNIWVYTGFLFEDLCKDELNLEILRNIDALVDGPFVQSLRDEDLYYRGSSNQRIIRESLRKL